MACQCGIEQSENQEGRTATNPVAKIRTSKGSLSPEYIISERGLKDRQHVCTFFGDDTIFGDRLDAIPVQVYVRTMKALQIVGIEDDPLAAKG